MPLCLFEFVSLLVELLLEGVSGTAMAHSLTASRLSRFAACTGAPSHRPSQGLGLRRFSKWDYSRDLRPAKWGSGAILHGSNPEPPMTALGQKQTSAHVRAMSAIPPKADIGPGAIRGEFRPPKRFASMRGRCSVR